MNEIQKFALEQFGTSKNSIIEDYKKSKGKTKTELSITTLKTAVRCINSCLDALDEEEDAQERKRLKKAKNELIAQYKKTSGSSDPFKGKDKTCAMKENHSSRRKTPSV